MIRLFCYFLCVLALTRGAIAQEVSSDPVPTLLISIDGFRPDYMERGITPYMNVLAAQGAHGALNPSFPTKTFPNHYAIVTGLRPDRNGIVGNSMIDPHRPGAVFSLGDATQSRDPFWWDEAEPIWVSAEKAGIRTATAFWPGSEVSIHKVRPRDWLRYDRDISNQQRVEAVLDWLRRPAAVRPYFITLYFDNVDMAGHRFGPDSQEVNDAIADVDAMIGYLVDGLRQMDRTVNVVIVSDHGMAATDEVKAIQLDELIDRESYIAVETGPYATIEPAAGTDRRVYDALLKPHDHMACYEREKFPPELHYGHNPRVAAIICLAKPGWVILSGPSPYPLSPGGAHGWSNAMPEMHALFIASGPTIKQGADVGLMDNIEVYPLLEKLIGLHADVDIDATGKPAEKILVK
ncbi:MAG: alkaline phosphatase family protein [Sphingomonadales bacterium]|nr:MAG: alkaline phosphatase family protein [Sphingomonadales bacterium]TNF02016.1 MAG: alkaline phosphatase family protein [Sphingomonadales bacterium]